MLGGRAVFHGLARMSDPMFDHGTANRIIVFACFTPLAPPVVIDIEVVHNAINPGKKARTTLKSRQVSPGANQGFLNQFFSAIFIACELQCHR